MINFCTTLHANILTQSPGMYKIVIFLLTVDGTSLRLARIIALEMEVAGMIIQASISSRTIMTTNRNPS